jgi:hypothetical protein
MLVVGIALVAVWVIIASYGTTFETIEDVLAAGSAACWSSWARADVSRHRVHRRKWRQRPWREAEKGIWNERRSI